MSPHVEPHLFLEEEIQSPTKDWMPWALSASLHTIVVLVILLLTRDSANRQTVQAEAEPDHRVELATLPPLPAVAPRPRSLPPPQPRKAEPQPPQAHMPRPQVEKGKPVPEDVTVAPEPPPDAGPLAEAPAERSPDAAREARPRPEENPFATPAQPTMEEEAQRLFGRPQRGVAYASGPMPMARWAQRLTDDRENDCRPSMQPARDPGAPPEMGYVEGRVFREGTSQPLGGAFLQILGTSYSTFADDDGRYRLSFDRSLVDNCRTQYVQVSKDGFRPRRLILGLGPERSNDIPMSSR